LGRDREARADAREVLDAGKASADDKLTYAEATVRLGRVDEGDKAIKDAVDAGIAAPKIARLKLLAQSWRGPKEAAVAAKLLEKERHGAAEHDARLAIDVADAYRRAGDLRKAGDLLRAAMFGEALALEGELWHARDKAKAKKAWKKYLEVAPTGAESKNIKRSLSQLK